MLLAYAAPNTCPALFSAQKARDERLADKDPLSRSDSDLIWEPKGVLKLVNRVNSMFAMFLTFMDNFPLLSNNLMLSDLHNLNFHYIGEFWKQKICMH